MQITNSSFDFKGPEFRLQSLLDIDMVSKKDEIEEVTDGADKQLKIDRNLADIEARWETAAFSFKEWFVSPLYTSIYPSIHPSIPI